MSFIAGGFTAVYGGTTIGQIQEGFTMEWSELTQEIRGNNFAGEVQDEVLQGIDLFLEFILMEFNQAAARELYWPFHATFGRGPVIGSLKSTIAYKSLVLTAVAGTPAAANAAEDVYTFAQTKLAAGFPVRLLKAPVLKTIQMRMRVYPDASNVFFTVG